MSGDDKDLFGEEDEFEKLLSDFINTKLDDEDEEDSDEDEEASYEEDDELEEEEDVDEDEEEDDDDNLALSVKGTEENAETSAQFEDEISREFNEALMSARDAIEEEENMPELGTDESELAQAFINFQSSVNKLAVIHLNQTFICNFRIDYLYPNYKPSRGQMLSDDLVSGWKMLCQMFPDTVGAFSPTSSDEEFLNFAEKLKDQDLQLAVISYVEILIDIESCELSYLAKLNQYQEKHIKRIMYEEYLARKERQQRFIDALKKKDFPIDAERLITNYFRVAQKDQEGAFKALTTNPAIFAPIDFSKIKPRLFGLIKVTPKDGIRVNLEIGNFLKKLKV